MIGGSVSPVALAFSGSNRLVELASQLATFGAKTPAGTGAFRPRDGSGAPVDLIAFDSVVSGSLGSYGVTVGAGGVTFAGDGGAPDGAVLRFTHAGGTVDITIDEEPGAVSVANWGELDAALRATDTAYGDVIRLRGRTFDPGTTQLRRTLGPFAGAYTPLAYHPDAHRGRDLATGTLVVVTGHASEPEPVISSPTGVTINYFDGAGSHLTGLRFTGLTFIRTDDGAMSHNGFVLSATNDVNALTIDNCTIRGVENFVNAPEAELWGGIKTTQQDELTIQDNRIEWVSVALNTGAGDGCSIVGNVFTDRFEDVCKTLGGSDWKFNWNDIERLDGLDLASPNEVHPDLVQWIGPGASVDDVQMIGNRGVLGAVSAYEGGGGQALFMDNMATDARFTNLQVLGNIFSTDLARGTTFQQTDGAIVLNNHFVNDLSNQRNETKIILENQNAAAADGTGALVAENVTHEVIVDHMTGALVANNDTSLDHTDDSSYDALFEDPEGGAGLSIGTVMGQFAPRSGGPLDVAEHEPVVGAIAPTGRLPLFDYAARSFDLPQLETGHTPALADLDAQPIGGGVSIFEQVTGVSATGALISISGGNMLTWEIRDTDNATVVETGIPAGARRVIYAGQYYEISDTTSAGGGVTFDVDVTVGTQSAVWRHTTVGGAYRALAVDNGAVVYGSTTSYAAPAGNTGTISFWFHHNAATWPAAAEVLLDFKDSSSTSKLELRTASSGRLNLVGDNAAGSVILGLLTQTNVFSPQTWYHVLISWDLANTTAHFYVNDVELTNFGIATTLDDTIPAVSQIGVFAQRSGGLITDAAFADVYVSSDYLDLSVEANRRVFVDAEGNPVDLTGFGSPHLLLNNATHGSWFNNNGSGGDPVETGGALQTAATSPSD